jgi:hypothetical protein
LEVNAPEGFNQINVEKLAAKDAKKKGLSVTMQRFLADPAQDVVREAAPLITVCGDWIPGWGSNYLAVAPFHSSSPTSSTMAVRGSVSTQASRSTDGNGYPSSGQGSDVFAHMGPGEFDDNVYHINMDDVLEEDSE